MEEDKYSVISVRIQGNIRHKYIVGGVPRPEIQDCEEAKIVRAMHERLMRNNPLVEKITTELNQKNE